MSVLDAALANMFAPSEKRGASSASYIPSFLSGILGADRSGKLNSSGSNYKTSLKLSAVFNAVEQISNSNAIIPYGVFQKLEKGRLHLSDHPVNLMLASEPDGPDGYLTSFVFKKIATVSVLLRGNALFKISVSSAGQMILKYIPWDDVQDIRKVKGVLVYMIKGGETLLANEVLHFKGFTHDGIVGVSVIAYACHQMNLALEVQQFSYTNFENKGVRNGVIETEKVLGSATIDPSTVKTKIKEGWASAMQTKSPDRIVVLDDGFKFKPINITPQEAQILEMSRFSVEDVARWFNIAPHKIKSLEHSTNNNIEQQSLDYGTDTMQPVVTNFEQEFTKKLFTVKEKALPMYVKGNMNVLLRADMNSRANYYAKAINFGYMTQNEARALEDMNAVDGHDNLLTPVNLQTIEQIEAGLKKIESNE